MITINRIYFDAQKELSFTSLGKIIRYFRENTLPLLEKYQGYYDGTGHEIMKRVPGDASRPNNKIVKNYCASIVDNFQGYITGIPITYSPKGEESIDDILSILQSNDVVNEDSDFLLNALRDGVAYELCYVNEHNEKKFKSVDARQVIPVYANDLDERLLYCIYFFPIVSWDDSDRQKYSVNVYTDKEILHYVANESFDKFTLSEEPEEHYFNQIPFVVFDLNKDNRPIFERVLTLQDAYNTLLSDEVNDFEAFVDAYMVLKNVSATPEELAQMKETRTILIDGEDDVQYLTKNISDTQIENMLSNLQSSIHTISNSPDFSSEEFNQGVSSGIALQFKLLGFNNVASNIEARFQKALAKRIELLNSILSLVDTQECEVEITFTHNLPTNIADIANTVNTLRGLVSDETLLAQIPFVADVDKEIERTSARTETYEFNTLAFGD